MNTRNRFAHTEPLFKQLKILKLHDLINFNSLKLVHKFNTLNLPAALKTFFQKSETETKTRRSKDLWEPMAKKFSDQCNIFFQAPKLWNKLPNERRNLKFSIFKSTIKKSFIESYVSDCNEPNCISCKAFSPF